MSSSRSGGRTSACSSRWRRRATASPRWSGSAASAARRQRTAWRMAASPIACTPTWMPERRSPRGTSRSGSRRRVRGRPGGRAGRRTARTAPPCGCRASRRGTGRRRPGGGRARRGPTGRGRPSTARSRWATPPRPTRRGPSRPIRSGPGHLVDGADADRGGERVAARAGGGELGGVHGADGPAADDVVGLAPQQPRRPAVGVTLDPVGARERGRGQGVAVDEARVAVDPGQVDPAAGGRPRRAGPASAGRRGSRGGRTRGPR